MIDTHSHLYDGVFGSDRAEVVMRDRAAGVEAVLLPGIDSSTHGAMWRLCGEYAGYCFAMVGLHPTHVGGEADWREELRMIEQLLEHPPVRIYGVGETGLDLYHDTTYRAEQVEAFEAQIELALRYDLPLSLHAREAWEEVHGVLERYRGRGLRGVMHAFSGTLEDYRRIREYGDFRFGIGGVVTYKKSALAEVVAGMSLEDIVLETDAPYLPPVPFRGERCESGMMRYTMEKIAELQGVAPQQVDRITTLNARNLFGLP